MFWQKMGQKDDITDFVKVKVNALHGEGYSQVAIAQLLKIQRHTVQNALRPPADVGPHRDAAKKPLMTEKQRLARIKFCQEMKNKTAEWWERVMFSDENTFTQVHGTGSNDVRRPTGLLAPGYKVHVDNSETSIICYGLWYHHIRWKLWSRNLWKECQGYCC